MASNDNRGPGSIGRDADESREKLAGISSAVKEFSSQAAASFELLSESLKKLNDQLENISGVFGSQTEVFQNVQENLDDVSDSADVSKNSIGNLLKVAKAGAKQFVEFAMTSKAAKIGLMVLHGAVKILSGAFKLLSFSISGVIDVISSLGGLIVDVAKGAFNFAMGLYEGLFDLAKQMIAMGVEYGRAVEEVRDKFGDVSKGIGKSVVDMGNQIMAGGAAGLSGFTLFENKADALRKMSEIAEAGGASFELLVDQFRGKNINDLYAFKQGLGLTSEQLAGMTQAAIVSGQPIKSLLIDVQKYARGLTKEFGGSFKSISRDVIKARMDVKHFAGVATKELAEAAIYARKLGVELEKTVGIMDAFDTFENAAENVAKLSQAFGVNLDVMQLLNAKTPTEQIDMIKSSFASAGKSVENMNRHELSYLATTLKLDEATTQQLLSTKNRGVSMDRVKKSAASMENQMLSTANALKDVMKEIPKIVRDIQISAQGFFGTFFEGFADGIVRSGPFRGMLSSLTQAIVEVRNAGLKLGDVFVRYFPGVEKMLNGMAKIFPKIGDLFERWGTTLTNFFKTLKNGKMDIDVLFNALSSDATKFFEEAEGGGNDFLTGLTEMLDTAGMIFSAVVSKLVLSIGNMIADGLTAIADQMTGEGTAVSDAAKGVKSTVTGALGKAGEKATEVFSPIGDAFAKVFERIGPQLKRIMGVVWDGVLDSLGERISKFFSEYKWEIVLAGLALAADGAFQKAALAGLAILAGKRMGESAGKDVGGEAGGAVGEMLGAAASTAAIGASIGSKIAGPMGAAWGGTIGAGVGMVGEYYNQMYKAGKEESDMTRAAAGLRESMKSFDPEGVRSQLGISKEGKVELSDDELKEMYKQYIGPNLYFSDDDKEEIKSKLLEIYDASKKNHENIKKLSQEKEKELVAGASGTTDAAKSKEAEAAQKQMQQNQKKVAEALGITTLDNVESRIKKMQEVGKKIMGGEEKFNEEVKKIRESLSKYDFVIMDKETSDKLAAGLAGGETGIKSLGDYLKKVSTEFLGIVDAKDALTGMISQLSQNNFFENIGSIGTLMGDDPELSLSGMLGNPGDISQVQSKITNWLIQANSIFSAINDSIDVSMLSELITKIQMLSNVSKSLGDGVKEFTTDISSVQIKNIDRSSKDLVTALNRLHKNAASILKAEEANVKVTLSKFASMLGAKGSYTIQTTPLNVGIHVMVKLDPSLMEQMILDRKDSIIIDAIDKLGKYPQREYHIPRNSPLTQDKKHVEQILQLDEDA